MDHPHQTKQARNKAQTRRNSTKVEQYLTEVEKAQGCATAWNVRQQLEKGDVTLQDLLRR